MNFWIKLRNFRYDAQWYIMRYDESDDFDVFKHCRPVHIIESI
jgi:hypothetical protein